MDINSLMNKMGFGESGISRRRTRGKIARPNHARYINDYNYIAKDPIREALQYRNLKSSLLEMQTYCESKGIAFSEDLADVKDKLADGIKKIKNTIVELIERAIRFFTETVRYFFSNEKKIGKKLAALKAANKKTATTSEKEVTTIDVSNPTSGNPNVIKSYLDRYGVDSTTNKPQFDIEKEFEKLDDAKNDTDDSGEAIKDKANEIVDSYKEGVDEIDEAVSAIIKSTKKDKASDLQTELQTYGTHIANGLENIRKMENGGMRGLNKEIRKLQDKLKEIKDDYKKTKDKSDDTRDNYKKDRAEITAKVKLVNGIKSTKDKIISHVFRLSDKIISDINKCANTKGESA